MGGSWISHYALQDDCVFPGDQYSLCIKFNKLGLLEDEYIDLGADHNWYTPLMSGQQVQIDENVKIDGTWIIAEV